MTAEVSIPSASTSTTLGDLATAAVLQPFHDAFEGKISTINPTDPNSKQVGAQAVLGTQLIISAFSYYDGAETQTASYFTRPADLSITGSVKGPFKVGTLYPGWTDRLLARIPQEWQASFGGAWLAGGSPGGIIGGLSWGPSVSVFDPTALESGHTPSILLLGYPSAHPTLGDWGNITTSNPTFNMSTVITGCVFPSGTASILFFGTTGTGIPAYGSGTANTNLVGTGDYVYDPVMTSKGTHAYPYVPFVWAYNAHDLLAVKSGAVNPWDVNPYSTWTLSLPFTSASIEGATIDDSGRIFIMQGRADGDLPVVHEFKVN